MAQALGIKIYTIGAGTTGIVPFPVTDEFGNKHYEQAQFDLDEDTLKKIAAMTGGEYFRAADTESLRHIYAEIDKLEKTKIEEKGYKQYEPLFWYFVDRGPCFISIGNNFNQYCVFKNPMIFANPQAWHLLWLLPLIAAGLHLFYQHRCKMMSRFVQEHLTG